ncbi:cytochrome P450 [Mycena crocata]|nr:cytochrome P450 [Mycena crocata]
MDTLILYGIGALVVVYVVEEWCDRARVRTHSRMQTRRIPTIGPTGILHSYWNAFQFLWRGEEIIQRGYQEYAHDIFRVPFLGRWNFIACGPTLVDDIARAPENVLSFSDATSEEVQGDMIFGPEIRKNPYHLPAVLSSMTRNLGRRFPDIHDEIVSAFQDVMPVEGTDWKLVSVVSPVTEIVARITSRLFVGLPLCRDPEYIKFTMKHTVNVVVSGKLIQLLPAFLRPVLGPLISCRKRNMREATKFMKALVQNRIAMFEKHGAGWLDKPNDMITWLFELASPQERTVPAIIQRMLVVLMAAIHTSSFTFTEALLDLATYPEYIPPLRDEAQTVVKRKGWKKAALGDMHKIDSFLRESQRKTNISCLSLFRKVVHPDGFTFSDGTFIPADSFVNVPLRAIHYNPNYFADPEDFDGLRFYNMRPSPAANSSVFKHYMVTPSPTHLSFGLGKRACPGRFFAAAQLKAMLAHVVLNYDVRLEDDVRPSDVLFYHVRFPHPRAKILFRRHSEE